MVILNHHDVCWTTNFPEGGVIYIRHRFPCRCVASLYWFKKNYHLSLFRIHCWPVPLFLTWSFWLSCVRESRSEHSRTHPSSHSIVFYLYSASSARPHSYRPRHRWSMRSSASEPASKMSWGTEPCVFMGHTDFTIMTQNVCFDFIAT